MLNKCMRFSLTEHTNVRLLLKNNNCSETVTAGNLEFDKIRAINSTDDILLNEHHNFLLMGLTLT